MSNDKVNATGHNGGTDWYHQISSIGQAPPVVPGHQPGGTGERPYVSPGPPPWAGPADGQGPNWRAVKVAVLVTFVLALLIGGYLVQRANLLPAGVPLVGKDSGLAACEVIAANSGKDQGAMSEVVGGAGMAEARQVFAESRYPAIRDNGVKLIDLAVQLQGLSKGEDGSMAALGLVAPFTQAYAGLAGGCLEQGVTLPALGS